VNEPIELDQIITLLQESGAFEQEQIDEFVGLHMAVKYQPETIEIPKPQFWFESDKECTLGNLKVKVRFINGWDIARLAPKVDNIYKAISSKEPNKEDGAPGKFDPVTLAAAAFDQALKDRSGGKLTPLVYAMFEELALLASTDKQEITTDYMFAVPVGQIKNFIVKLVEVNQQDFLELFGVKHQNLGSVFSTLIGKVFSTIEKLKTNMLHIRTGSAGGQSNTGATVSGTPLKKQSPAKTPAATR